MDHNWPVLACADGEASSRQLSLKYCIACLRMLRQCCLLLVNIAHSPGMWLTENITKPWHSSIVPSMHIVLKLHARVNQIFSDLLVARQGHGLVWSSTTTNTTASSSAAASTTPCLTINERTSTTCTTHTAWLHAPHPAHVDACVQ